MEKFPLYLTRKHLRRSYFFTSTFRNYYWEDLVVILFTLTHPSRRLNTCFKTGNMLHLKKALDVLQVVNKETQSLLLFFNRFHILFRVSVVDFE